MGIIITIIIYAEINTDFFEIELTATGLTFFVILSYFMTVCFATDLNIPYFEFSLIVISFSSFFIFTVSLGF